MKKVYVCLAAIALPAAYLAVRVIDLFWWLRR